MKLLKFTSPTCGMCRVLTQKMNAAKISYESVDVSTDEGMHTAERYGVSHLPVVLLIDDDGRVMERYNTMADILRGVIEKAKQQ